MTLGDLITQATAIQNQVISSQIRVRVNGEDCTIKLKLHTEIPGFIYVDMDIQEWDDDYDYYDYEDEIIENWYKEDKK
jgi:hypothetical protein